MVERNLIADTSVEFVRSFSPSTQDYKISIFNDETFEFSMVENHQSNIFIVDVQCPNIVRVINQVNIVGLI